ncbi:hypothetical protein CQA72_29660, partial [Klebsiella pneumoniae]
DLVWTAADGSPVATPLSQWASGGGEALVNVATADFRRPRMDRGGRFSGGHAALPVGQRRR